MYDTLTLGELIDEISLAEPAATVQFDFCYLVPTTVKSYRGYYDHLAIGWSDNGELPSVLEVLNNLREAVGEVFVGYKGGEYRMGLHTPVWVANYGETGSAAIDWIDRNGSQVIIHTKHARD